MQGFAPTASIPTASLPILAAAPPDGPPALDASTPPSFLLALSSISSHPTRALHFGTMPAPPSRTIYIGAQTGV
jgi:hypothetical protein